MSFRIQIASVPDRDETVCEIWFDELLFAEIRKDASNLLIIDIYNNPNKNNWIFDAHDTINIIKDALTLINPTDTNS